MKKSFYRIGEQITLRPWDRPNYEAIATWWNSFKETKHLDQYEVWICGGALEGTETWDVDIILTGESRYPADLKPFKRIRNFNEVEKQIGDKNTLKKYGGTEIYPGLYQQQNDKPTKSFEFAQKMIKEGKYTLGIQKLSDYIYNNKHTI